MNTRVLALLGAAFIAGAVGIALWSHGNIPLVDRWMDRGGADQNWPDAPAGSGGKRQGAVVENGTPGEGTNQSRGDPGTDALPLPPFPPRIAESDQYDKCMTMIADDPEGAEAIATSWQAAGGGDAAVHCQALAAIASGEPESGAAILENLVHGGRFQGAAAAVLLGQAAEARLMADQAEAAKANTTEALAITPDDPDLLISRANASDALEQSRDALDDLDRALQLDPSRGDALVLRAAVRRRSNRLPEAQSDIDKALALDPEDAEALLERGILRQLKGDVAGARADWTHARDVDPNSEAAELATQNLTLLDAGPDKK